MRPPIKHIAALLAILYLETYLLWKLDWSPYSPSKILAPVFVRPFQDLHTPFTLVRLYRQTTGRRPYQAPLIPSCDGEVIPHSYSVYLHPGYSIEEHKRFVGAEDLQRHVAFEFRSVLGYHAEEVDEAMLQVVRADVGVERVEVGCMVGGMDPIEWPDYDEVQHKLDLAMLLEELWGAEEWVEEARGFPGLFADLRGIEGA